MQGFILFNVEKMTNISTYPTATPESVWAAIQESNRFLTEKFAETDRLLKESSADFDRRMKESNEKFDRFMKESKAENDRLKKESNDNFERRMKKLEEDTGSWSNNYGNFAEEYFLNSFDNDKRNL